MSDQNELRDYLNGLAYGQGGNSFGGALGESIYHENREREKNLFGKTSVYNKSVVSGERNDSAIFSLVVTCWLWYQLRHSGLTVEEAFLWSFGSFFIFNTFFKTSLGRFITELVKLAFVCFLGFVILNILSVI